MAKLIPFTNERQEVVWVRDIDVKKFLRKLPKDNIKITMKAEAGNAVMIYESDTASGKVSFKGQSPKV